MRDKNYFNDKGYPDPTAYRAEYDATRQKKVSFIVSIILFIVWEAGFRLKTRIVLEDRKTGKLY